jgi:hypothetical protein
MLSNAGPQSFVISTVTTAPTDGNTVVLFDSTTLGRGYFRHMPVKRISFGVHNSHAGTLNAYRSTDFGANWRLYDTRAVVASPANEISGPYDYLVDTFLDWKLEWVNGGTTQTTWRPEMHGHENREPGT